MFAAIAFGALLAAAPMQDPQVQDPGDAPVRLEDVVVNAERLEETTEAFVDEVAAPVRRRGMARWHRGVCVGVVNLQPELAQFMSDRISDRARSLGLTAGEPGCHPSILVVATADANAFTRDFVEMRPALFRVHASGMDRGRAAFEEFLETERPIRWWTVSQPVDSDTGRPVVRMPGQCNATCIGQGSAIEYGPNTPIRSAARLSSQYRQDIKRTFVIVDVERLGGATIEQISDYIAMVALAQIDPEADTERFDSILNLFDPVAAPSGGLTGWDLAYLQGLYEAEWYRINQDSQVRAISDTIARTYRGVRAAQEEDTTGDGA